MSYVHLTDVAPPTGFDDVCGSLTEGDLYLDNVIKYFRTLTNLSKGVIDFRGLYETLQTVGYDAPCTIEIENRTEKPVVHTKENCDYWQVIRG